jgi:lipopolysaccharide export system ATP-binding protein
MWTSETASLPTVRPINGHATSGPLLQAHGLCRAFDGKSVLRGLSLQIRAGEVIGVVAPNGSGKSTLLDVLSGVLPLDRGSVHIGGRDVTEELSARRGIFYVPQSVKRYFSMKHPSLFCYLPDESVRDNLLAQHEGDRFQSSFAIDTMLARFGLTDVAGELPGSLSAGMQQRLALARAVGSKHPVLLLDEPLASVDRPTRLRLLSELATNCSDRAILYVTHDVDEIAALGGRLFSLEAANPAALPTRPIHKPVLADPTPFPPAPPPRQASPRRTYAPVLADPTPFPPASSGPKPAVPAVPAPLVRPPAAPVLAVPKPAPPRASQPKPAPPVITKIEYPAAPQTPPQHVGFRDAAAAAGLEAAGLVLAALVVPPPGKRGLVDIVADFAEWMRVEAERLRPRQ